MFFLFVDANDAPVFGPGLERFEIALDLLRKVDPIMPIGAASTLVHIARRLPRLHGGSVSLSDIAREMGLGYTTFMRHADLVAEGGANIRRLDLLEKGIMQQDKRARTFRATEKGLALLRQIDSTLGDSVLP